MSVFSDRSIKRAIANGDIKILPYSEELVQPSSIDVRLGDTFRIFRNHTSTCIDPKTMDHLSEEIKVGEEGIVIHPGEFLLGTTLEHVTLPADTVARLEGKSSLGRLGLIVHATAGYIDPGFSGQITLEMSDIANLPIRLYPGMRIGQLSFHALTEPAERPYGTPGVGKYQGQTGPTDSRSEQDFKAIPKVPVSN
ncbi:MAG: dCTP deaminase [Patescibacteria group bacterium]